LFFFSLEFILRKGRDAKSILTSPFDRGTTILIGAPYPLGILLPPILNYLSIGRLHNDGVFGVVGICLMVLGLVVRLWSMQTLGRFYTRRLTVTEDQQIVQAGPYRFIRHPGYLGTLLIWIGLPTSQANWISIGLMVLFLGFFYGRRIITKESMLVKEFGEEYRKYMKRTWRLVPLLF
jgi:protein-S-isoprenylcysteine O-methyltransferase Ste14